MYIDSHAHLDSKAFESDRQEILQRAWDNGLKAIISICVQDRLEGIEKALALTEGEGPVFATVGVHPHDARNLQPAWMTRMQELAAHPKVVGIGETGLDYHYMHSPKDAQLSAFRAFLHLGRRLNLPVVIHTRTADEDTIEILDEMLDQGGGPLCGVVHCFSGDYPLAAKILDTGLHLSFTGIVTFPKAGELREVVKKVPLERILLETDSPYLSPVPFRGRRNEPSRVVHVAEAVAGILGTSKEEVGRATSRNTARLFGLHEIAEQLEET